MTPKMRETLEQASKQDLRRVWDETPGKPPFPAPASTLAALVRRGFLDVSERLSRHQRRVVVWSITEEGKAALKAPEVVGTERPVFPAKGGGSTHDWTRAVDHDPKMGALDDMGAPSEEWLRVSRVKRAAVRDRREVARELARQIRRAA